MPPSVDINTASPAQIATLLGLSLREAERVAAARPFLSLGTLRAVLPARIDRSGIALDLPKVDINVAASRLRAAGLVSERAALAIEAARPLFFLGELRALPGVSAAEAAELERVCAEPALSYRDKLAGSDVQLAAQPDALVVLGRTSAPEPGRDALELEAATPHRPGLEYRLFRVAEVESASDVLVDLKQAEGVEKVVPGFQDGLGVSRYVDPEFLTVQFAPGTPAERTAGVVAAAGADVYEEHRTDGLFTLRVRGADRDPSMLNRALEALNASGDVRFAEPAYLAFDDLEAAPAAAVGDWNLALIDLPDAFRATRGSPDVVVAVIDSGVDIGHPALQAALLQPGPLDDWNFDSDAELAPHDELGHGTFIAGILGADGSFGVQGVCPGCRLLPLKIPTTGRPGDYARRRDAMLYALDRVPPGKRLIINLSWKTTGDVAVIRDAVQTAVQRGVPVVTSAGNWPQRADEPHFPSDYPVAISVGAVDSRGRRAAYSFYGQAVDLAAPGGDGDGAGSANIRSLAAGGGARLDYGTSFSAPHVAGALALVLSVDPSLPVAAARQRLQGSAQAMPGALLGSGLIDVGAAVGPASPAEPSSDEPPTVERPTLGLAVVNTETLEGLIARFGLARMTARLLVARRPFSRVTDLRDTLGLTAQQYAAIVGTAAEPSPGRPSPPPAGVRVNSASLEALVQAGLPRFTASVVVVRRPFARVDELRTITGMPAAFVAVAQL